MICRNAPAQVRLSEADLKLALQTFLNQTTYNNDHNVDVTEVTFHKKGSKFPVTVDVVPRPKCKS